MEDHYRESQKKPLTLSKEVKFSYNRSTPIGTRFRSLSTQNPDTYVRTGIANQVTTRTTYLVYLVPVCLE